MVCFQRYASFMVSPSTQQPPGKRLKAGWRPTSISIRSGRSPWPFQVFLGISETMSSQNVPALSALTTNRACGSVPVAVSVAVNFLQSGVRLLNFSWA